MNIGKKIKTYLWVALITFVVGMGGCLHWCANGRPDPHMPIRYPGEARRLLENDYASDFWILIAPLLIFISLWLFALARHLHREDEKNNKTRDK